MNRVRAFLAKPQGLAIAFVASLLLGLCTSYVVERVRSVDRVLRGVSVAGVRLGGLDRTTAVERVRRLAKEIATRKVEMAIQQHRLSMSFAELGWKASPERHVDRALAQGRTGSIFSRMGFWLGRLFTEQSLPLEATVAPNTLAPLVATWERERVEPRAFAGALLVGSTITPEYPREGLVIDSAALEERILRAALLREPTIDVPLETEHPALTKAHVDDALARAKRLTSAPITLVVPEVPEPPPERPQAIEFRAGDLLAALESEVVASPPALAVTLDPSAIAKRLDAFRANIEVPSRDAEFKIDAKQQISIVPSSRGVRIDDARAVERLLAAAETAERRAELPLVVADPPKLETAEAETLGVKHLVARFTTFHNCCEPRVKNIHRIADLLNGVVVRPGETFSVNEYVGPRTEARGFVLAPTIVEGDMEKTLGGGISQFATTLFNAVLDAGYEIIQRQPHSYYFHRYPVGHEATLSYPSPDLIFKNDSQAGLLIRTEYGEKFIRVLLYGDNGGRKVTRKVGPRIERTEPPIEYVANPAIPPDAAKLEKRGVDGWSVLVSRTVTFPDGTQTEQRRKVTYSPRPRVVQVHPCNIPRGKPGYTGEECPEPAEPDAGAPGPGSGMLSLDAVSP